MRHPSGRLEFIDNYSPLEGPVALKLYRTHSPKYTDSTTCTKEPPHDKTNNMAVRPATTQIRKKHNEGSDQTGQMARLILVFAGRTCHFVDFVMRRLKKKKKKKISVTFLQR